MRLGIPIFPRSRVPKTIDVNFRPSNLHMRLNMFEAISKDFLTKLFR